MQLEIVSRGEVVHVLGYARDALRILKRLGASPSATRTNSHVKMGSPRCLMSAHHCLVVPFHVCFGALKESRVQVLATLSLPNNQAKHL